MTGNTKYKDTGPVQFHEMGLDDRILEAIAKLGWKEPTPVQKNAIPYVLEGKDVLARARTGSGKTGAFSIPAVQKILEWKHSAVEQSVQVLVLAPTKELCKQTYKNFHDLTFCCRRDVRYVDVSPQLSMEDQHPLLLDKPDVVIGTPMKILAHINAGNLNIKKSLKFLVIDEADLMFTFDHVKDIEAILRHLPKIYQSFVTSATMWNDVKKLKKLVLNNPVILNVKESPLPTATQLTHYAIKLQLVEKVILLTVIFRLNMIRGKTLIFVNTVDKGYKLRMYLAQFGMNSCVLNSEMPLASRCHIVEQFNSGKYDIIIASDEHDLKTRTVKVKGKRRKDKESGVVRGIDFQFLSNVINFDFPVSVDGYIHRVGRTARGDNQGTALSLVAVHEMDLFEAVKRRLKKIMRGPDAGFKDFKFDMKQLDGFRYRALDAWKRCTTIAIRETRKRELHQELLNSSRLRSYFEDNPRDLQLLKHDTGKHGLTPMAHLKNVPEYNIPQNLRRITKVNNKKKGKGNKKIPKVNIGRQKKKDLTKTQMRHMKRKADPLKSMEFSGFKKQKT